MKKLILLINLFIFNCFAMEKEIIQTEVYNIISRKNEIEKLLNCAMGLYDHMKEFSGGNLSKINTLILEQWRDSVNPLIKEYEILKNQGEALINEYEVKSNS